MRRFDCRLCGGTLSLILDLGKQPASNALHLRETDWETLRPLELAKCEKCDLLQLTYDVTPNDIFNTGYPLHSSKGSRQWLNHIEGLCGYAWGRFALNAESQVIEIGSNDGYLLRNYRGSCKVLGVDPAGISSDVPTVCAEFSSRTALTLPKADLVFAINTVAQIPDLHDFCHALHLVLKKDGVAVFEFPDLVRTINETQFDTIYHEHYSYLSVTALDQALRFREMSIFDVEHIKTHGGSLRVFVGRGSHAAVARSVEDQKICERGLDYVDFATRVRAQRRKFIHFMTTADFIGLKVAGYGAAARGNTFLNYCFPGAESQPLTMIGDVSPAKIGMYTPGLRIPIVSEADLLASKPDYIVILAWTWKDEAMKRLRELGYAGSFVVCLPEMRVTSA